MVLLAHLGLGDGIPGDHDAPVEVEVLEALPEHIGGGVVIGEAEFPAPLDARVSRPSAEEESMGGIDWTNIPLEDYFGVDEEQEDGKGRTITHPHGDGVGIG